MKYPQRIVCLTVETTETLYAIGAEDRIVGISGFTVRPERARKEKPKVSAFTSARIGRILELKPDLVVGFSDMQADIAAELVRSGVAVHIFNQRTVAGILSMIRTLGGMLGLAEQTDAYAQALSDRVKAIRSARSKGKGERPERPGWADIPAVANNHLYEIKSPLILQPGPAALTDGLDALCGIIDRVSRFSSRLSIRQ